jgi:hypothetical protein
VSTLKPELTNCVRTCSGFHLLRFHLLRLDLAIVVGRLDSDVADLWVEVNKVKRILARMTL